MLTPEELQTLPSYLVEMYSELSEFVLRDIARRIAEGSKITDTAEYQMYRAKALGQSQKEISAKVAEINGLSAEEVEQLILSAAKRSDEFERRMLGADTAADTEQLMKLCGAEIRNANGAVSNLTGTLGFAERGADGKVIYSSMTDFLQKTMDAAHMKVAAGATDHITAVRQACNKLAASGLRTVYYESGHSDRIEVAVRRAVMTSVSQVSQQISELNSEEFGADGWEISAHSGARPSHAIYQGRQYPQEDYERIVLPLIDDYNCRHSAFPIIMGVTPPTYTEEELRNLDPPPFVYEGRRYTAYEAQQQMRFMERQMRKQKDLCIVANAAGDKEAFTTASIRLRRQKDIYEDFCEAAGCYTEYERTVVMGYDRHLSGKTGAVTRKNRAFERAQVKLESDFTENAKRKAKSLLAGDKIIRFDELSDTFQNDFRNGLKTALPDTAKCLSNVMNRTDYCVSAELKSFYNRRIKYVQLGTNSTTSTLAHELFHKIDIENNISSNTKYMFLSSLKDDWNNLLLLSNNDPLSHLANNYPSAFTVSALGKLKLKEEYRGISDIISAVSGDTLNLGYHHKADYWAKPGNIELEAWAQFGRITYDNNSDVMKMFTEVFTNFNNSAIIALKAVI